jgi:hypothetical protein
LTRITVETTLKQGRMIVRLTDKSRGDGVRRELSGTIDGPARR